MPRARSPWAAVSGGAFNPAVAFGASVLGLFAWSNIWVYLLAQFVGGVAAAAVFLVTDPGEEKRRDAPAARAGGQVERGASAVAPGDITPTRT